MNVNEKVGETENWWGKQKFAEVSMEKSTDKKRNLQ